MLKYDNSIDTSANTSLSLIVQNIQAGTKVLEFGPSTGYMTKYLKEELKCSVTAVEIDPDSAEIARQYCEKLIVANIETYPWHEEIEKQSFDYIIFSDVLEHLYDPWKILNLSKEFLKEDGVLITSIPNVAHSSIIISLLEGEFRYQKTGLLDNTHIRFFTKSSIEEMLENAGLTPIKWSHTTCSPEQSELHKYAENFSSDIKNIIKSKGDGQVYQYITLSKIKNKAANVKCIQETPEGFDLPMFTIWYLDKNNNTLKENDLIKISINPAESNLI